MFWFLNRRFRFVEASRYSDALTVTLGQLAQVVVSATFVLRMGLCI